MKLFEMILREGEGGSGAGAGAAGAGAGGAPAGAGAGAGAGGSAPSGEAGKGLLAPGATGKIEPAAGGNAGDGSGAGHQPAPWKLPDGLPDHLKADKVDDFATKLFDDWKKQRTNAQQLSEKFKPPENIDGYKYQPSEKAKPFVGDLGKDPVFGIAREAALKAGVPGEMFSGFIGTLYDTMAEKGMLPKPYEAGSERAAFLGERAKGMTPEQQIAELKPLIDRADNFVKSFKNIAKLDDASGAELLALADSAAGLRVLQALQNQLKLPGLQPGGQPAPGGLTHAALKERQRDPRNDIDSPSYSKEFAEETRSLYKQMFQ